MILLDIGIQMKRKELTKKIMVISNWKKRIGHHGFNIINSAFQGLSWYGFNFSITFWVVIHLMMFILGWHCWQNYVSNAGFKRPASLKRCKMRFPATGMTKAADYLNSHNKSLCRFYRSQALTISLTWPGRMPPASASWWPPAWSEKPYGSPGNRLPGSLCQPRRDVPE